MEPELCQIMLNKDAKLPLRCTKKSAGYDLTGTDSYLVPPGGQAKIPTAVSLACPPGCYARVADRSSNAYKKGLLVTAGVIDPDYRSQIYVVIWNFNKNHSVFIPKGAVIAQLIFERYSEVTFHVVEELNETERGSDGFGQATSKQKKIESTIAWTLGSRTNHKY